MSLQLEVVFPKCKQKQEIINRIKRALCPCDTVVVGGGRENSVFVTVSDRLGKGNDIVARVALNNIIIMDDDADCACPSFPGEGITMKGCERVEFTKDNMIRNQHPSGENLPKEIEESEGDEIEEGPFVTFENSLNDLTEKLRADIALLKSDLSNKCYDDLLNRKQILSTKIFALNEIGTSFQDLIEEVWDGVDRELCAKELGRFEKEMQAVDKSIKEYYDKLDTIKKVETRLDKLTKLVNEYTSGEEQVEWM